MFDWLKKLTGDSTLRTLGAIEPAVEEINRLGEGVGALPDEEIRARSLSLRDQVQDAPEVVDGRQALEEKRAELEAETDPDRRIVLRDEWKRARRAVFEAEQHVLADVLPEAFALVREAARRTIGQVHFDSQLKGGIVLHQGKIAEMKTGEGKTLTATLPLYLNALAGHGAHLVTVNDYLARRDCGWMGEVFYFLGLSTGVVIPDFSGIYDPDYINEDVQGHDERLMHLRPCSRHEAYLADISYGTNNEFGFDYLRDNMAHDLADVVQRELYYAIVDEVDNILVDEARTPLIISAPDEESYKQYVRFARVANGLGAGDYEIEEKERLVTLTDQGVDRVEKQLGIDPERGQSLYDADHAELTYFLDSALKARFLYRKDTDYVVREGQVVIVDEFTGRMMPGRRWSDGIHESIEAKEQQIYREKVEIQRESKTYATITLQNYFRLYQKVAGMSGTAATEQEEFFKIYGLEVVTIPTYKPMIRDDAPDRIYAREEAKLRAVVRDILHNYCLGRPVLVGTTSVATSERLAGYLDRKYVALAVLMPLVARALRAADLGGETQRTLREIFGEPLERFGVPFQNLARAALLAPGTLREELFTRAADQVERLIEAQEGRERSQRAADGQDDEEGNRERARERKKQRGGEQKAIRQALQEATQGAFDQVVTMLDLQAAEEVERLRKALDEGIPEAQVLNAKQHEREALVIAKAGQKHAVTIATNMAGRGVDIILGGDPTQRAYERLEPFLLDKDRHVQRAVDALLGSPNAESSLPRVRGFLPAPLAERSTAVDGDGYLHDLARWMWQEVEGAQGLKEQLKEVPLPRLLQQRIGPRYPDVEPQPLGELVTLIDKSVRRKPFERHELREWAAEHNLGHLVDEAVGRVRRVFRTEHYVSAFRLQTELATLYGLEPGLAKDFADAILREGQVPSRQYIFRWAQDGGIPRYVVEGAWQEYDYLASVGSPDRLRDMVAGRLYTSYMNGLTALLRAVLGGNQTRGQEVIAATPALPAFFVEEVARVRQECEQDRQGIRALGGLRITGTERHEARRIDNQLRGRSGRLGDPGYSQFYVSTEDELMRRFGPGADRMRTTIERFNLDEETVIEARVLSGMIEQAQVKVEGFHFDIRKHLVEYDDVLNRQRDVIYAERRRILDADDVHAVVLARLREEVADRAEETFAPLRAKREYERDREAVLEALSGLLEEIQAGRHSRESARMPLFPIVVHIIAEGLRQDPAMQVLARLQELNGKLRQGEVQAEEAQAALAEMATLARQGGAEDAAAELERVGAEDTAAHVGAQLATWRETAESVLRAGLQEIIEAMLLQNQQRFEESVSQAVARFLEEGEGDERGLHLTRLYRGLTKEWGIYLPPSVSTARWMGMAPAEIEAEVLEAVRNQAVDNLPRSRQRLLEQISRVVRDWSAGQSDWLVVEKFLGEHRLPAHLAAEPLLDLLDGDINAFQDAIVDELHALAQSFLDDRGQRLGAELLNQIEQRYLLEAMDREWIDYLTAMEELRQGIGLRAYGQQDPLVEYRRESFHLFERLMQRVRERSLFYIYASAQVPVQQHASTAQAREDRRVEGAKQAAAEVAGQPAPGTPGAARAPGGGKKHRKRKRK